MSTSVLENLMKEFSLFIDNNFAILISLGLCVALAGFVILINGDKTEEYLNFSFINNSILLKTETIEKNGFHEVWRQVKSDGESYSVQILCYNPETFEFQAFDRFQHLLKKEPYDCSFSGHTGIYQEDLWTPIKLHYTMEWFEKHLKQQ